MTNEPTDGFNTGISEPAWVTAEHDALLDEMRLGRLKERLHGLVYYETRPDIPRNVDGMEAWEVIERLLALVKDLREAVGKSRAAFEALLREVDPEIAAEHAALTAIKAIRS